MLAYMDIVKKSVELRDNCMYKLDSLFLRCFISAIKT
jgi:hypothetical protein